jgi:hypothetical protein
MILLDDWAAVPIPLSGAKAPDRKRNYQETMEAEIPRDTAQAFPAQNDRRAISRFSPRSAVRPSVLKAGFGIKPTRIARSGGIGSSPESELGICLRQQSEAGPRRYRQPPNPVAFENEAS